MDGSEYDALVDRLADRVIGSLRDEDGRRIDGADDDDALWSAVGAFVPEMEADVCEAVLDNAAAEPLDDLVEEVAAMRESDENEQLRAEAFTVLLQDVNARVAARDGYQ
ncbi:hypothetical protein [Halostella sp. PRR32]|uniref:hypothetical protein n=1 Tax=Halostella sp. PRR32 TaxID=3098147 RepID=UPI002B1D7189|nr:hypothetical protein [Halostella sp. PRR32]